MKNVKEKEKTVVNIKSLDIKTMKVSIKGTAPLIVHKWSDKAKRMMLDKQMGIAKTKKHDIRDPEQDYHSSIYWINEEENITGFPAVGIKAAMVRTGIDAGYKMVNLRRSFFVRPTHGDLIEIFGEHRMREDMVRIGNGSSDIRFRAEYPQWGASFEIEFNQGVISKDEVMQLLYAAGFGCGIGEWRPEKSNTGSYGTWTVI